MIREFRSQRVAFRMETRSYPFVQNGAGTPPCRFFPLVATILLFMLCTMSFAIELDRFYLRDGTTLSGNIVRETPDAYKTLIQATRTPFMTNVPVKAVRYVVYGSPQKAIQFLELDKAARALGARDSARIQFLPTDAFGEAITEAASSAHTRNFMKHSVIKPVPDWTLV